MGSEGLLVGSEGLAKGSESLSERSGGLSEGSEGLPEGPEGLPEGLGGGTEVRTDVRMGVWTYRISPHSTGLCSLLGLLQKRIQRPSRQLELQCKSQKSM